jgi:hypothetical protein
MTYLSGYINPEFQQRHEARSVIPPFAYLDSSRRDDLFRPVENVADHLRSNRDSVQVGPGL